MSKTPYFDSYENLRFDYPIDSVWGSHNNMKLIVKVRGYIRNAIEYSYKESDSEDFEERRFTSSRAGFEVMRRIDNA